MIIRYLKVSDSKISCPNVQIRRKEPMADKEYEEVDIIPTYDIDSQFKKIRDTNRSQLNNKISTLLNYLEIIPGKNSIFPSVGVRDLLSRIPYSPNVDALMAIISNKITQDLGFEVDVEMERDIRDMTHIIVNMTVGGLPGLLKFSVSNDQGVARFINPRYLDQ